MKLLPVWRTPIEFGDIESRAPRRLTWGLVTFELMDGGREFGRLDDLDDMVLEASRFLAGLARDDRKDSNYSLFEDSNFSDALEEEARSLEPLRQFRDNMIGPHMDNFRNRGNQVTIEQSDPRALEKLVLMYGPRLTLKSYGLGDPTLWGLRCSNLVERAVVELFDLFQHRPTLARCSICWRVFAPHGEETSCRWHIWQWPASVGDRPIEYCDQTQAPIFERAEVAEHRREWSRLNMRVRRARQRYERAAVVSLRSKKTTELRLALQGEEATFAAFERRPRGRRIALRGDDNLKGD